MSNPAYAARIPSATLLAVISEIGHCAGLTAWSAARWWTWRAKKGHRPADSSIYPCQTEPLSRRPSGERCLERLTGPCRTDEVWRSGGACFPDRGRYSRYRRHN
jgi:hypothetical protein